MAEFYTANAPRIRAVLTSVVSGAAAATAAATEAGGGGPGAAVVAPVASPASLVLGLPAYRALEWRLAVRVASRLRPNEIRPAMTLRLDTSEPKLGAVAAATEAASSSSPPTPAPLSSSLYFEADAGALGAAIGSLEAALAEVKSANMRRMMRYLH